MTRCVIANHFALTIELPISHGSTRTLNAPFADKRSDEVGCAAGENIKRKLLSALRWRMVTDILSLQPLSAAKAGLALPVLISPSKHHSVYTVGFSAV